MTIGVYGVGEQNQPLIFSERATTVREIGFNRPVFVFVVSLL